MIHLQNDQLKISIAAQGAELQRIHSKDHNIDYLWDGNPRFWAKKSPVLFPIVGALNDDSYSYKGKSYKMTRHGFARDQEFTILHHDNSIATFELNSSKAQKEQYPFDFLLRITYSLQNNTLSITYSVFNKSTDEILFSIGGHPAFHVPLEPSLQFEDFYLEFHQPLTLDRWPLNNNLISSEPQAFLNNSSQIPLTHSLFSRDAIVFKNPASSEISLKTNKSHHGITCSFQGFPYLGIWAAPNAPFVCIEPWHGIADHVNHNQNLEEKEGIIHLHRDSQWERSWNLTFF